MRIRFIETVSAEEHVLVLTEEVTVWEFFQQAAKQFNCSIDQFRIESMQDEDNNNWGLLCLGGRDDVSLIVLLEWVSEQEIHDETEWRFYWRSQAPRFTFFVYPNTQSCFEEFPEEKTLQIFSLMHPATIWRSAQTCKQLNRISEDETLWIDKLRPEHHDKTTEESARSIFFQAPEKRLKNFLLVDLLGVTFAKEQVYRKALKLHVSAVLTKLGQRRGRAESYLHSALYEKTKTYSQLNEKEMAIRIIGALICGMASTDKHNVVGPYMQINYVNYPNPSYKQKKHYPECTYESLRKRHPGVVYGHAILHQVGLDAVVRHEIPFSMKHIKSFCPELLDDNVVGGLLRKYIPSVEADLSNTATSTSRLTK